MHPGLGLWEIPGVVSCFPPAPPREAAPPAQLPLIWRSRMVPGVTQQMVPETIASGQKRSGYEFWFCRFLALVTSGQWLNLSEPLFPHQ